MGYAFLVEHYKPIRPFSLLGSYVIFHIGPGNCPLGDRRSSSPSLLGSLMPSLMATLGGLLCWSRIFLCPSCPWPLSCPSCPCPLSGRCCFGCIVDPCHLCNGGILVGGPSTFVVVEILLMLGGTKGNLFVDFSLPEQEIRFDLREGQF